ncbi:MAG: 4-hydroxy-tetrahydrodipicolinate reductase [Flavobacteriales bacterium]|nr:4-hydroxy-tetrahydrodipicolinate reductase [Flavobacteriales bacterium]
MKSKVSDKLRVLIIGRGRMGTAVQESALFRGHEVVAVMGRADVVLDDWPEADVAVEFTAPTSVVSVMAACRDRGIPLVSGTTGWTDYRPEVEAATVQAGHPLVWAPNFSKGVYLFRKALKAVAEEMQGHAEFQPSVHEVHHTGKVDAPSGTALAVADDLHEMGWNEVGVTAQRLAGVPGTHQVEWRSEIDSMSLVHSAHNRRGFAQGAVEAAEWLVHRSDPCNKIFGMNDVWG